MKTNLTTLTLILIWATSWAQTSKELNLNDTSYCRIFNGTILTNSVIIKDLGNIQYISDKQKIDDWGIKTTKELMIVNVKSFKIEYQIDSILYSRKDFSSKFKFPSSIELPIAINGKLLTYEDRKKVVASLELNKIKDIQYIGSELAMKKYSVTPFGVIDLILN